MIAERCTGTIAKRFDETQRLKRIGTAIDEVAYENNSCIIRYLLEKSFKAFQASLNIADGVYIIGVRSGRLKHGRISICDEPFEASARDAPELQKTAQ